MSTNYWSRMRKYSRARRAVVLHFTRHEGDSVIRVALANRPAHDLILLRDGITDRAMYHLVKNYTRDLTREELRDLTTN